MLEKKATIKQIARKLNISVSTVSRALHDHPSIGLRTKTRVQELAKQMNYEPNQTAIFFQQGKTFTLGVILPELSESFFSAAISGIEDTAYNSNYTVLIGQSHDSEARERLIVESMKNHRVDGLIVSISKNTTQYDHFEMLKKHNIPVVFFDRIPKLQQIHYVASNMESGTMQAVNFLLKKGHRIIGMINGPEKLFASQERLGGYIKSMKKNRLKFDPNLIITADLTKEGTQDAMSQLLAQRRKPTGIVLFNDYVALYAVEYARKMNLEINKDITFVSFANLPINFYTAFPPIASVEQFPYKQGQKATEIMLQLLEKQQAQTDSETYKQIIIEPTLIVQHPDDKWKL